MLIAFALAHAIAKKTWCDVRGKISKLTGCHLVLLGALELNSFLLMLKRKGKLQT